MNSEDYPRLHEIRELFGRFNLRPVELRYSVSGGKGTEAAELIITGGWDCG